MSKFCINLTSNLKQLSKDLNISETAMRAWIGAWQYSENKNIDDYPSEAWIRNYVEEKNAVDNGQKIRYQNKTYEVYTDGTILYNGIQSFTNENDVEHRINILVQSAVDKNQAIPFTKNGRTFVLYKSGAIIEILNGETVRINDNSKDYLTVYNSCIAELDPNNPVVQSLIQYKKTNHKLWESNVSDGNITLSKEQQIVVEDTVQYILERLQGKAKTPFFNIKGMAGVGKTTVVQFILNRLYQELENHPVLYSDLNISVAAVSNKASTVIYNKLKNNKQFRISRNTVYKLAGTSEKDSEVEFKINPEKSLFHKYNIIIIDEASMIDNNMYSTYLEQANKNQNKVFLFLGDYGQLKPVENKNQKSQIFTNTENVTIIELTERFRQSEESPILKQADNFYRISIGSTETDVKQIWDVNTAVQQVQSKGAFLFTSKFFLSSTNKKDVERFIEPFRKIVFEGASNDSAKIIIATNDTDSANIGNDGRKPYNDFIHKALFGNNSKPLESGEPVVFNDNYSEGNNTIFYNSDEARVIHTEEGEYNDTPVYFVTLKSNNKEYTVPAVFTEEQKQVKRKKLQNIYNTIKEAPYDRKRELWRQYWEYKDSFADIDLAYAITSHKAQGSTYDMVFVDYNNMTKSQKWSNQDKAELLYTGVTRAANIVVMMHFKDAQGNHITEQQEQLFDEIESFVSLNESIKENKIQETQEKEDFIDKFPYINHSGGAVGSDSVWDEIGQKYGVTSNHYYHGQKTPKGNIEISEQEFEEGKQQVLKANETLQRKPDKYMNLLARNWMQVKNSTAIYAIGVLNNGIVNGGTGWAVQMAIDNDIPVFVFDQEKNKWFKNINGNWEYSDTPELTHNFAGIGTREINESGKKAIEDVYKKTFEYKEPEVKPLQVSKEITDNNKNSLNIYFGSNENAELSNLASRHFEYQGEHYASVEAAFQAQKLHYAKPTSNNMKLALEFIKDKLPGNIAKILGRKIENLDVQAWDKVSSNIMKDIIKTSLEQNPQTAQKLIDTGDTVLTHVQDNSKWRTEFPRIMMEIREEFKNNKNLEIKEEKEDKAKKVQLEKEKQEELQSINNLLNPTKGLIPVQSKYQEVNSLFTPITKARREKMIANLFTQYLDEAVEDYIFELENNREEATSDVQRAEIDNLLRSAQDPKTGRQFVLNAVQVKTIVDKIKQHFKQIANMSNENSVRLYGESNSEYIKNEYSKLDKFFDVLFEGALLHIEEMEGVRINIKENVEKADNSKTNDYSVIDSTIEENKEQSELLEELSDQNTNINLEYKARMQNPYKTMNKKVKSVLSKLLDVDAQGVFKKDDLGESVYISANTAFAILLDKLSYMTSIDDFILKNDNNISFPALESIKAEYPWVSQIINAFYRDNTLISSFYTSLRQDYVPKSLIAYSDNKGKYVTINSVESVTTGTAFNALKVQYLEGQMPEDSIYTKTGKIDSNILKEAKDLSQNISRDLEESYIEEKDYKKLMNYIGIKVPEDWFKTINNRPNYKEVLKTIVGYSTSIINSIDPNKEINYIDEFKGIYKNLLNFVSTPSNTVLPLVVRELDAAYPVYTVPCYFDTLFKNIKRESTRKNYLENQYKKYDWFYNKESSRWYSEWLNLLYTNDEIAKNIEVDELLGINGKTYGDWTSSMIDFGYVLKYFSSNTKIKDYTFRWFHAPIFSDSETVKFVKMAAYKEDFEKHIINNFKNIVLQELQRITHVQNREKAGVEFIDNYDGKRGKSFCFLPELNNLRVKMENGEYTFYTSKTEGPETLFINNLQQFGTNKELKQVGKRDELIEKAVAYVLNNMFENSFSNIDDSEFLSEELVRQGELSSNFTEEQFKNKMKEFFYNQYYATSQIIQMTVTDLAFYKGVTDFQKRYKEVLSSGNKLNTKSQYGKTIERTIYIKDNIVTSRTYSMLKQSLDQAVKEKRISNQDKKNILKQYQDINVSDAQAYRTLDSLRSVLDMQGNWSESMQESYDRIMNNEWDMNDLNTVWLTVKPFMFTQIPKEDTVNNTLIKVGHQNKNSEFVLLALYSALQNPLNQSNHLKAINRFMQDNNIDVVQFNSTVKTGGQGIIDINYSKSKLNNFIKNYPEMWNEFKDFQNSKSKKSNDPYTIFKQGLDNYLDNQKLTQEQYNSYIDNITPTEQEVYDMLSEACFITDDNGVKNENKNVIHELPYEDYMIVQPSTEHLIDVEDNVLGSQFLNLIISDLPEDFSTEINGVTYNKQQIIDFYNRIVTEKLLNSFEKVKKDFTDIESVQRMLLSTVQGNTRYSKDLVNALEIVEIKNPFDSNKTKKVFNIPMYSPSMHEKMEELMLSVFKKGITKQTIRGGACVLVTSYGLSNDLQIVYKNNDPSQGLEGIECYLPAYSKQFFEPFLVEKEDGTRYLDVKKLKEAGLEKAVGYRIPTENKYSMVPLIIKGFLPQQNNSVIMLPPEITTMSGCDFDFDKMFIMLPSFTSKRTFNTNRFVADYMVDNQDADIEVVIKTIDKIIKSNDTAVFEEDNQLDVWDYYNENKDKYYKTVIRKEEHNVKNPEQDIPKLNSAQIDNALIEIAHSILTNPKTHHLLMSPGNFNTLIQESNRSQILENSSIIDQYIADNPGVSLDSIAEMLLNEEGDNLEQILKKYQEELNPLTLDTYKYLHKQNTTASKLIGIYANNTTAHSKCQTSELEANDGYIIVLNGKTYKSLHDIISPDGEIISDNCAECSAASVDAVKNPVLDKIRQNTKTANVLGTMIRLGIPLRECSLLFMQPEILEITKLGDGYISPIAIQTIINEKKESLLSAYGINYFGMADNLTSKDLVYHIISRGENLDKLEYKKAEMDVLQLLKKIASVAEQVAKFTMISRADSPNGAIATNVAGARSQIKAVESFIKDEESNKVLKNIDTTIKIGTVNINMNKKQLREILLQSSMPRLQSFFSLGIELPYSMLSEYFIQQTDVVENILEQIENLTSYGSMSPAYTNIVYKSFIRFALSDTSLFGDEVIEGNKLSLEEKRFYYLTQFPKRFMEIKAQNPEIANIPVISKIFYSHEQERLIFKGASAIPESSKEFYKRDLDSLLYMDNKDAQELAKGLLMYSYYIEGLNFGPNSFSNFFSVNFLNSFPELVNCLREMPFRITNDARYQKFLKQCIVQNPYFTKTYQLKDSNLVNLASDFTDPKDYGKFVVLPNDKNAKQYIRGYYEENGETKGPFLYEASIIYDKHVQYNRIEGIIDNYNINKTVEELLQMKSEKPYLSETTPNFEEIPIQFTEDSINKAEQNINNIINSNNNDNLESLQSLEFTESSLDNYYIDNNVIVNIEELEQKQLFTEEAIKFLDRIDSSESYYENNSDIITDEDIENTNKEYDMC